MFNPALLLFSAPPGGGTSPLVPFLVQIAAIIGIFYFLLIRPQQKQRRAHEERIRAVKKGDSIITAGGLIGEVVHIREGMKDGAAIKSLDDAVTIRSGESRLIIERRAIARVVTTEPETK